MNAIHNMSAGELAAAIADGRVSSRDALAHYLVRVEQHDPALNAVIALNAEAARERADAADAALARGERWGPLHGVPMTVKDTFEVLGFKTVVGEPKLADYDSERNAVTVQRLLDAGAIIFGKTNTPRLTQDVQTFNAVFGTTNNPWNTQRTPGGSSGGAAAALAAGLTPLELGSDLAGSIRTPCNWCGVYGHKPSQGIVPLRGHVPGPPGTQGEPDLAVAGPMTRTAGDLALALDVLAGPASPQDAAWRVDLPDAEPDTLADFRVACLFDHGFAPVAASTVDVLQAAAYQLQAAGAQVTRLDDLPLGLQENYRVYDKLLNGLVGAGLPEKLFNRVRRGALLAQLFRKNAMGTLGGLATGAAAPHHDWARADEARHKLRQTWHEFFADYDVLLLPVTPVAAIAHDHGSNMFKRRIHPNGRARPYTDLFRWIAPATVAGLPATVAPVGNNADELPVGLQIVADYGHDKTTIAFAAHLSQCVGGFAPPPGYA